MTILPRVCASRAPVFLPLVYGRIGQHWVSITLVCLVMMLSFFYSMAAQATQIALSSTPFDRYDGTVDYTVISRSLTTTTAPCTIAASASSTLVLPVGASVRKAYLYWNGAGTNSGASASAFGAATGGIDTQVTFKNPAGTVSTVTATQTWEDQSTITSGAMTGKFYYYAARTDVTTLVTGAGLYTIGGINSVSGNLSLTPSFSYCAVTGNAAGWVLVVIYNNPTGPIKTLALYEGFDILSQFWGLGASNTVNITGFTATAAMGVSSAYLTPIVWQGDSAIAGDTLLINGNQFSDTNVFNGSGTSGLANSNHAVDADILNISNYVPGSSTSLAVTFGSAQNDVMIAQALIFSSTALTPNVSGYKSVKLTTDVDSSGTITAGDTLTYTVSYVNTGGASASNFQINDVLPNNVTVASVAGIPQTAIAISGTSTTASKNTSYTGATIGTLSDLLAASATLAPQGVITVTIPVTVNLGYFGSLSNRTNATATGLSSTVQSVNVGKTTDLPATVTAGSYNLTVPASSVSQTSPSTGATLATVVVNNAGAFYTCDGYFYQMRSVSAASRFYRIARLSNPYTEDELFNFTPYDLNALGFNKTDGYFYALTSPTSATQGLIKIGQSGAQTLGAIAGLPDASYVNGTFDNAGNYYVARSVSSTQFYKINVASKTATLVTLSSAVAPGDMAINPTEAGVVIYALNKSSLSRIVVVGNSATVTATTTVTGITGSVGTAFFDASGTLYAYSDDGNFYQVDIITGVATQVSTAPNATSSDGASCAFTASKIDVLKSAGVVKSIDTTTFDVSYTLKLVNKDSVSAPYVQVADSLAKTFVAGPPTSIAIQTGPTATAGCTANNSGANKFDGINKLSLLAGTDTLPPSASCTISFTARISYPNAASVPAVAQNNSAYASAITSTGTTPNPGHSFLNGVLIQPPNVLSVDTSTNGSTVPASPGADKASVTPVILSGTSISGTVFEDVNYGGGIGRSLLTANGIGLNNVQVELYDSTGAYLTSTFTDATGKYVLFGVTAGTTHYVRVVNNTVPSSRPGYTTGLMPVQTYRTDDITGTIADVLDRVGGEDPTKIDADNAGSGDSLSTATATLGRYTAGALINGQAQSISAVKVVGGSVSGIDFGYNFDSIVNKNDTGQGSLRQFITNSNALTNTGLAQVDQATGKEVSLFMISDGAAHPGLRVGLTNQLTTGGVAIISAITALPTSTDSHTTIDGTTQTTLIGDTNSVVLGKGGTVGIDALSLATVNGPEIQLVPSVSDSIVYGLDLQGSSNTVRGLSILGFGKNLIANPSVFSGNIHVSGTDVLIEKNLLGASAKAFTAPASGYTLGSGIIVENTSVGTVHNNLIGFNDGSGVVLRKASSFTVSNNEISRNDLHDFGSMDGISTVSDGSNHSIVGNLISDNGASGIDNSRQNDIVISNNTIKNNGFSKGAGVGGVALGFIETPGIRLGGSLAKVTRNEIFSNYGAGILARVSSVTNDWGNPRQNTFSQNSIYDNGNSGQNSTRNVSGKATTAQIGIDLEVAAQNTHQGTSPFVTPNNGVVDSSLPNDNMDYPVIVSANKLGQILTVNGYIGDSEPVASFGGAIIELFIGDNADSMQPDFQLVASRNDKSRHYEGKTYLGSCTADSDGSFSCSLNNPLIETLNVANLTATATSVNGSTSEFGGLLPDTTFDTVSGTVFLDIGKGSAGAVANNGNLDGGELGIAAAQMTLTDCATNAVLGKTITDSKGFYSINIPSSTVNGVQLCLQETNAISPGTYISTGASQTIIALTSVPGAVGIAYVRSTDMMQFKYQKANSYSTLNFGDVPPNQFLTDGVKSSAPGNTVTYSHSFIAGTPGTVTFSLPPATASPVILGWSETLYTDTNCDGTLDSNEVLTVTTAIKILKDEKICLIVKEFIPANASSGVSNLVPVRASFVYTNAVPALTTVYNRHDLTTVTDAALELKKRVRNVSVDEADPANAVINWQVSNTAKSGEVLEYQIQYTNNTTTPINTLVIKDITPAYTTFISALADVLPNALTDCTKITPASVAPVPCVKPDTAGGTGDIEWRFTGALAPGATGLVTFRVMLE